VGPALTDVSYQAWTVVVFHDVDVGAGALAQLPRFLDELSCRGVDIVQDFPESCFPNRAGPVKHTLSHLTMETAP
jgi:hypothetical protein